ncbi:MAG: hypothetical protein IJ068_05260 [Bacilli bacterium]|nr:hypothetical protein [Bacilli bacterium]
MKKVFLVLVMVMTCLVVNVKAMTESELKTKIANGFVIAGETIKPSEYQLQELERYLNKYDVSETDADFISGKIDEIINLAKEKNVKSFTDLSSDDKAKVVAIVSEISSKTSVKVTLTKNGVLTIYESDGKTPFTEIKDKDITKQTGTNNIIFIVASVISLCGICYVARKAIKENA